MSETTDDLGFESKKFLVELIYDLCINAGFPVGGVDFNKIASITYADDKDLEINYKLMLYGHHVDGVADVDGFGNQKLPSTEERYSSLCATVNSDGSIRRCTFFEMCVAIANFVFMVKTIDDDICQHLFPLIPLYLRSSTFEITFLCDTICSCVNTGYFFCGKGLIGSQYYGALLIQFTDNPRQLILDSDETLSMTTRDQLKRVNGIIEKERSKTQELKPAEESPLKAVTKDGALESENRKGWLSHSPTKCERV
jgi:hypothetical protein